MRGFKDRISADVDKIFADTDIFFEVTNVDGKEMRVMLDSDKLRETRVEAGMRDHIDGLYAAELLAYIPVSDYGAKPRIGKPMVIGTKHYIITDCTDEAGIYTFSLRRHRQ